jgi:hypothetical protein
MQLIITIKGRNNKRVWLEKNVPHEFVSYTYPKKLAIKCGMIYSYIVESKLIFVANWNRLDCG